MPVQTQMSSFAKKMGNRVAQASAEHKDKPVDVGNRRLPPGIKNGVAKISALYTKEYGPENKDLQGNVFFRASAIVMSPEEFNGEKTSGIVISKVIPMCDVPAKGQSKAKSFSANFYEFQNILKMLTNGAAVCPETPQTDPTGQRTEAFYFGVIKSLLASPTPIYIKFSSRAWTPPASPQKPKPEEMVFDTWEGLVEYNGQHDPAAQVNTQPNASAPPPQTQPTTAPVAQQTAEDPADKVAALVEIAMNDPNGETPDGAAACKELEEMAWAAGATKDHTKNANDWGEVGEMALGQIPTTTAATSAPTTTAPANTSVPTVGSKWKYAKRTSTGERLKNGKGVEFPPQEVEVLTINASNKTCTLKSLRDNKEIVDMRSKKPVDVKFEWLEA